VEHLGNLDINYIISGNVEILKKKRILSPKKGFFPKKKDHFMGSKEYFRI
jgi:hypothetical protein